MTEIGLHTTLVADPKQSRSTGDWEKDMLCFGVSPIGIEPDTNYRRRTRKSLVANLIKSINPF